MSGLEDTQSKKTLSKGWVECDKSSQSTPELDYEEQSRNQVINATQTGAVTWTV